MSTEKTNAEESDLQESSQSRTDEVESTPSDDRYADPGTDEDPRTSDEGMTSIGAVDLNADEATNDTDSPEAVPGVRSG